LESKEYVDVTRVERKRLKTTFTDPGSVGESCRGLYDSLNSLLSLPADVAAAVRESELPMIKNGFHHIIPAFFQLVCELDARRDEISLKIVFRTFGIDIANIALEFNAFCEGRHPLYPNVRMDGSSPHSIDRRLRLPDRTARLMRCGFSVDDVHMAYISSDRYLLCFCFKTCTVSLLKCPLWTYLTCDRSCM